MSMRICSSFPVFFVFDFAHPDFLGFDARHCQVGGTWQGGPQARPDLPCVTCTVVTPSWGGGENVSVKLLVNKVEAGTSDFTFYNPLTITSVQPPLCKASESTRVTLRGQNIPSTARHCTVRVLNAANEEVCQAPKGLIREMEGGQDGEREIVLDLGPRLKASGPVHFSVSVNGVDYDETYEQVWACELTSSHIITHTHVYV